MTDKQRKYLAMKLLGLLDEREVFDAKHNIVYSDNPMYDWVELNRKPLSEYKETHNEKS